MDLVKSAMVLCSGKFVVRPILEPCEEDYVSTSKSNEGVEPIPTKDMTESFHAAPFQVDKAKVELFTQLPPAQTIREVCSFLGHAEFYRRFIKNLCLCPYLFLTF